MSEREKQLTHLDNFESLSLVSFSQACRAVCPGIHSDQRDTCESLAQDTKSSDFLM